MDNSNEIARLCEEQFADMVETESRTIEVKTLPFDQPNLMPVDEAARMVEAGYIIDPEYNTHFDEDRIID